MLSREEMWFHIYHTVLERGENTTIASIVANRFFENFNNKFPNYTRLFEHIDGREMITVNRFEAIYGD